MSNWKPFIEVWRHIQVLRPAFLSKSPHFNFITIHYFWIIGLAILGSILLYPAGGLAYIDALFFASGSCTQSGLNTVDINLLNTYQQIVLFFLPMLTNPITINTFVVFIRLYWFEKRFQHVVREARHRHTTSKSRSQMNGERDIRKEEQGVNGREIVVLHHTTWANGMTNSTQGVNTRAIHSGQLDANVEGLVGNSSRASEGGERGKGSSTEENETNGEPTDSHPQIKFAENVRKGEGSSDEPLQSSLRWTERDHLAVLERQRNPQDREVLRIPGPRDSERGAIPETVDEEEAIRQIDSRRGSVLDSLYGSASQSPLDGPRNIISELHRRVSEHAEENSRAAAHTLGALRFCKPRVLYGGRTHEEGNNLPTSRSRDRNITNEITPYLSWQPTVGRNSAFVNLSESQREELGGIEYRSLKSLASILVLYFWGFTVLGIVGLVPWIYKVDQYGAIVEADGQDRAWWGFFITTSAFNDVGFTLTPDNMISFQTAIWPLIFMSFLVIVGNTGFPIMLRWIIWITSKWVPKSSGVWEELEFLLDHPRRCFTLLFPSKATWWLFWILISLNGLDLILFIILDIGNTTVTGLPINIRILDGWFQAVSTRTAGFSCVNLAALHPAIQVSYLVMMYISVLPIAISVRRTNVYEEKSLGIYGSPVEENEDESEPSYVGAHLRRQLSFDLWYIFLGFFIITISEGPRIQSGDPSFTMFTVLFEVVSAYGTVGLSLGYPGINASFSAEFGVIAKLVIIAMQIRGRHRGLPYELDRAILLPSETLHAEENHDAAARIQPHSSIIEAGGASNRGRSKNHNRGHGPNFLSSMLHPGPSIPNSNRHGNSDGSHAEALHGGSQRESTSLPLSAEPDKTTSN